MTADKGKKQTRPPDGRLRVSQLVTTFGPGAMVDLLDHAVLIGGLEYWRYDSKQPRPTIDEDRLREAVLPRMKLLGLNLSRENTFMTGPPGDDDNSGPWNGIQVAEFPHWFVCQTQLQGALSLSLARTEERALLSPMQPHGVHRLRPGAFRSYLQKWALVGIPVGLVRAQGWPALRCSGSLLRGRRHWRFQ
jgi:hypothetical protein